MQFGPQTVFLVFTLTTVSFFKLLFQATQVQAVSSKTFDGHARHQFNLLYFGAFEAVSVVVFQVILEFDLVNTFFTQELIDT